MRTKAKRGVPSRCARCLYVTDSLWDEKPEYVEVTCSNCGGLKKRITYTKIQERLAAALAEPDEPQ